MSQVVPSVANKRHNSTIQLIATPTSQPTVIMGTKKMHTETLGRGALDQFTRALAWDYLSNLQWAVFVAEHGVSGSEIGLQHGVRDTTSLRLDHPHPNASHTRHVSSKSKS